MSHLRPVLLSALLALSGVSFGQALSADSLLKEARSRARAERKNVLVIFGASWCKWCKRLDRFLAHPDVKPAISENFITVHLTIFERAENLALENEGAEEVMAWMGGKNAGLPFVGILTPEGRQVATSIQKQDGNERGVNIGHPVSPDQVSHFLQMIQKGAARISPDQLETMRAHLTVQSLED